MKVPPRLGWSPPAVAPHDAALLRGFSARHDRLDLGRRDHQHPVVVPEHVVSVPDADAAAQDGLPDRAGVLAALGQQRRDAPGEHREAELDDLGVVARRTVEHDAGEPRLLARKRHHPAESRVTRLAPARHHHNLSRARRADRLPRTRVLPDGERAPRALDWAEHRADRDVEESVFDEMAEGGCGNTRQTFDHRIHSECPSTRQGAVDKHIRRAAADSRSPRRAPRRARVPRSDRALLRSA